MISCFQAYPELLCVDATYKLFNLGLPTYLFLSEDSNGQSEIVAVNLLVSEDAEGITWMLEAFKKFNHGSPLELLWQIKIFKKEMCSSVVCLKP